MAQIRYINTPSRKKYISGRLFFGLFLVELGFAWIIGEMKLLGLNSTLAFAFMFGTLLILYSTLRRGNPYRVGKVSFALGLFILLLGFSYLYGFSGYIWALLLVAAGIAVILGALNRRNKRAFNSDA
jgi:peptidoglycan/LPS O-acetylase OafA/YrhL